MERRNFIKLSAFASAAVSIPLLNSCTRRAVNKEIAQPVFLSRLFDEKTIETAGKAYLKKVKGEDSTSKLEELLSGEGSITSETDVNAIHSFLDNKVRDDFETGKTVVVQGWVLSITEARQCALYALINS
jgi:hypothetical protein